MKYFIFDLDNCLSDDGWRIDLIDWSQTEPDKRYAAYHAECQHDCPANLDTFRAQLLGRNARPVFFTARPQSVRAKTLAWIERELKVETPWLYMRGNDDHRPSVDVKRDMLRGFVDAGIFKKDIECAWDDHKGVLNMYREEGIDAFLLTIHDRDAYNPPPAQLSATNAGVVLAAMAETFRERSGSYKDNYKMVPKLVQVLFPDGVPPEILFTDHWHLFELKLVKLSRFAISGLTHLDSIHDDAVYSAMIEACLLNSENAK